MTDTPNKDDGMDDSEMTKMMRWIWWFSGMILGTKVTVSQQRARAFFSCVVRSFVRAVGKQQDGEGD